MFALLRSSVWKLLFDMDIVCVPAWASAPATVEAVLLGATPLEFDMLHKSFDIRTVKMLSAWYAFSSKDQVIEGYIYL